MYEHICSNCNCKFSTRKKDSKFCSRSCLWINKGWSSDPNTECTNCKKQFHLKPSAKKRYKRTLGFFCSNLCVANYKSKGSYDGNKNPNYKSRSFDSNGYPLRDYTECCSRVNGLRRMKLHQAVCCEVLGVTVIPSGFHVHHRDCDVMNNNPDNLVVLNISDHKWLHKQYGSATLWAQHHKKIKTSKLVSWSDDKYRAGKLLDLTVLNQSYEIFNLKKESNNE